MEPEKIKEYIEKIKEIEETIDNDSDESIDSTLEDIIKITNFLNSLESEVITEKINIESISEQIYEHLFGEFRLNYSNKEDRISIISRILKNSIKQ